MVWTGAGIVKRVVLTVKLIITIGAASLFLAGCQNATLSEITKRTSSVTQSVSGNNQRVGSAPTKLEINQGSSSTEMIVTWVDGGLAGSIYRIDRSSDGGRTWQLRSRVPSGVQIYRDTLPKGGGRFLYKIKVERSSVSSVEVVEKGAVQKTHQQQLAEERAIKEAKKREEERRAREIAAAEEEAGRIQAEKEAKEKAEKLAAAEAERVRVAAETAAKEEAEREAQRQAELRAQEEEKRARQAKEKRVAALLKQVEKELDAENLSGAEKLLGEYREKQGKSADKVKGYRKLKQRIASRRQVLDDLEQARDAERYMKQSSSSKPGQTATEKGKTKEGKKSKPRSKSTLLGKNAEGWVVQVATYPEAKKREAYSLLSTIKKSGFRGVFLKKQELAGRVLYRLRLGAYGDKDEALELQDKINLKMADQGVNSRVMRQKR